MEQPSDEIALHVRQRVASSRFGGYSCHSEPSDGDGRCDVLGHEHGIVRGDAREHEAIDVLRYLLRAEGWARLR